MDVVGPTQHGAFHRAHVGAGHSQPGRHQRQCDGHHGHTTPSLPPALRTLTCPGTSGRHLESQRFQPNPEPEQRLSSSALFVLLSLSTCDQLSCLPFYSFSRFQALIFSLTHLSTCHLEFAVLALHRLKSGTFSPSSSPYVHRCCRHLPSSP